MLLLVTRQEVAKKRAKGLNALWEPARLVAFAIFWWLPKGVVMSAAFAQQNQNILLLLQAGEDISLYPSVALYARQKWESGLLPYSERGLFLSRARGR